MTAKQRTRQSNLGERIKATALDQIADRGAATLSLRAIARSLGITAPAIYNYFPRRDDLVTALIVEAFQSFGLSLIATLEQIPSDLHVERLRALGEAYRQWALDHPQRYQLIFGTPIPGYVAPQDVTGPAAAESLSVLVQVLQAAHNTSSLRKGYLPTMEPEVKAMLKRWQTQRAEGVDLEVLYLVYTIWGRVHGLVSLEIGNQFPPFIDDPGALFRRDLERLLHELFTG